MKSSLLNKVAFVLTLVLGWSAIAMVGANTNEPNAVPGEYIVKYRDKNALAAQEKSSAFFVKSKIEDLQMLVVQRPAFELSASAIQEISNDPDVEYVEPNYIYTIQAAPNDPEYGKLWGLKNTGQVIKGAAGVEGIDVNAERAWELTVGSRDVLVAVIDTGINSNHPDIKDNMWVNEAEANGQAGVDDDGNGFIDDLHGWNFVSGNGNANALDDHGHGTHCAGTIGGHGNDGVGVVGVAWKVKMMSLKFLSASGSGSLEGAVKSIDYATKMGVDIMSNSWGGGGFSQALVNAITRAEQAGILFVAAAGNSSANNDANPAYPASYDVSNIVSVAAINNKGGLASFSNYGKKKVHIGAPGVDVYSSVLNGHAFFSGTSMATPHVSGVAALLKAYDPSLTSEKLKERLLATARPIPGLKGKTITGGMVDAYAALTNTVPPPDENDPSLWAQKEVSYSNSVHPYANSTDESIEIQVPDVKEFALYFSKLDTENRYDFVRLYDAAGNKIAEYTGNNDDSYSVVIQGNYVRVQLVSDHTVNRYGYHITKIAYR